MKKILIGSVIVIAGVFGYFIFNKNEIIKDFVTKNLNKTYHLKILESNPAIKEATITLKSYTDTKATSDLIIIPAVGSKTLLPLTHKITIGSAENNGETFGAGKVITTIDYDKIQVNGKLIGKEAMPKFLTNDFITLDSYIGLDGSLRVIANMKAINDNDNGINFDGIEIIVNSNLKNKTVAGLDILLNVKQLSSTGYQKINLSGFKYKLKIDNNLNMAGTIDPISFSTVRNDRETLVKTKKATMTGKLEHLVALDKLGGQAKLSVAGLEIHDPYKGLLKFDKLSFSSKFINAEDGKSADIDYSIDVTPNKESFKALGSTVGVNNMRLDFSMSNIPNEVLKVYFDTFENNFYAIDDISVIKKDDMKKVVSAIFASNFKINFDVSIDADEGSMKGALDMTPSKTKLTPDEIISTFEDKNSPKILTLLNANIDATIDESLATKTGLSMLMQMSPTAMMLLKLENGKYTVKGSLNEGNLTVNGSQVPIPGM